MTAPETSIQVAPLDLAPIIDLPPLEILYTDESLLAVHKPSGLFVHRTTLDARVEDCLLRRVRDFVGAQVHAVHRLDRGTSGIVLFARSSAAAAALSAQFEAGRVEKRYLAIVRGHPPHEGRIDHALVPLDPDGNRLRHLPAQAAVSDYRVLATVELPIEVDRYPRTRYAFVELRPLTGRRHQLRRHLKHIAHPVIGDATYGKGVHNRFIAGYSGVSRLLLACTAVGFTLPESGEHVLLEAAPAADFRRVADALGWQAVIESAGEVECADADAPAG